ncbi:hypothetical protein [Ruania zhangjianzhongii]|uniref:hypothetical protein n=1 Tax=Ruania zhangjianzhongii TaxID=2603206 RepID=UPI0011C774B8|nr:hypothetical protein [Ruania zhangjianzhongii]
MGSLPEEGRARIRASVMWLIAAIVVVGLGIAGYAAFLGFPVSTPTTVLAAAPVNSGHGLLVRYEVGSSSCQIPGGVTLTETDQTITLTGSALDPTGTRVTDKACTDDLYTVAETVWLTEPLAGRTVLDSSGAELELTDPAEVLG